MNSEPASASVAIGQVLGGKYRVERILDRRGTGLVLVAEHLGLKQPVAIKLLDAKPTAEHVERFFREARAAARVPSAHVVRVLDTDRLDTGQPYIVLELLEGQTLERVVAERGPLPVTEAVDFLLQGAEAMARAHEIGIVHRDLRPANLFLTQDDQHRPCVKVLDFGICKLQSSTADAERLTGATVLVGSPHHMAPEQWASAADVDGRCDIWALGAVLYELLAARPAFDGPDLAAICRAVQEQEPIPLESLRPDVPQGMSEAIRRCLQKDPAARFSDVGALSATLAPFASAAGRALLDERRSHAEVGAASRVARSDGTPNEHGRSGERPHGGPTDLGSAPTVLGSSPTLDGEPSAPSPAGPTLPSTAQPTSPAAAPGRGRQAATVAMPPVVRPPSPISVPPPAPGVPSVPPPVPQSLPPPVPQSLPPPVPQSLPPPVHASVQPPPPTQPRPGPAAAPAALLTAAGCLVLLLIGVVATAWILL